MSHAFRKSMNLPQLLSRRARRSVCNPGTLYLLTAELVTVEAWPELVMLGKRTVDHNEDTPGPDRLRQRRNPDI